MSDKDNIENHTKEEESSKLVGFLPKSTERLIFRRWRYPEDLPLALQIWGDSQVTKMIGGPFDNEKVIQRLKMEVESDLLHGVQYWPIFTKKEQKLVGCCGLHHHQDNSNLLIQNNNRNGIIMEIGFHLLIEYWGNGFATEAGHSVIESLFLLDNKIGNLNTVQSLFAGHHPNNLSSQKVILKLGLKYTHHELYQPTGIQHPCYLLTFDQYMKEIRKK